MNFKYLAIFLLLFFAGCSAVEFIHTSFNKPPVRLVSAKRTEYFEVVIGKKARLSDVAFLLTGSRSTIIVKAANPSIKSDIVSAGTVVRFPTAVLKPGIRLPSAAEIKAPTKKEKEKEETVSKKIKKITLPRGEGEEILPETFQEGELDYNDTPFKHEIQDIKPYVPPKPTPDRRQQEEEKLRDKYKDIMKELD